MYALITGSSPPKIEDVFKLEQCWTYPTPVLFISFLRHNFWKTCLGHWHLWGAGVPQPRSLQELTFSETLGLITRQAFYTVWAKIQGVWVTILQTGDANLQFAKVFIPCLAHVVAILVMRLNVHTWSNSISHQPLTKAQCFWFTSVMSLGL